MGKALDYQIYLNVIFLVTLYLQYRTTEFMAVINAFEVH